MEAERVRLRRVRHGKDGTADSGGEGRKKECVLKSNERGFLAQMTAERRETFVTAPPQSLFSIQAATFSKNAVAFLPPPPLPALRVWREDREGN